MRPVKLTIRAAALFAVAALASGGVGIGCAPKTRTGVAPSGTAGATGAAGAPTAPRGAGAAGGGAGTSAGPGTAGSGTTATGAGGAGPEPIGVAGAGTVPTGAGGTVDQGRLFTDAATVIATDAGAPSTPETSTSADSGKTAPGDGNVGTCHIGGMSFVLVFTQKGTDVTMVVTASNCAAGSHTFQVRGGFSCDNAGTEGGVWDGKRGDGIPMLTCANNKGTLTYTRSGADPATSWTVGDHNTKTDVTLHPMSADTSCGTFF
jgi:hypothetical protein